MRASISIALIFAACFAPAGMRPPPDDTTTTGSTSAAPLTAAGASTAPVAPTSTHPASTTTSVSGALTSSESGPLPTTSAPPADLPPECPRGEGQPWGLCAAEGICDDGVCWLAPSGWACAPECLTDADCEPCALSADTTCDAGRCRSACEAGDDCEPGALCDAGACVWPSDCGPGVDLSPWHPCPMGACDGDTICRTGPAGSVCAPACPCEPATVCAVDVGEPTCDIEIDLCELPCAVDDDCAPAMRCDPEVGCAWPT